MTEIPSAFFFLSSPLSMARATAPATRLRRRAARAALAPRPRCCAARDPRLRGRASVPHARLVPPCPRLGPCLLYARSRGPRHHAREARVPPARLHRAAERRGGRATEGKGREGRGEGIVTSWRGWRGKGGEQWRGAGAAARAIEREEGKRG